MPLSDTAMVLQRAGLEPRTLIKDEALVVVQRILAHELMLRGVSHAATVSSEIELALRLMTFAKVGPESPEASFARFGRK